MSVTDEKSVASGAGLGEPVVHRHPKCGKVALYGRGHRVYPGADNFSEDGSLACAACRRPIMLQRDFENTRLEAIS